MNRTRHHHEADTGQLAIADPAGHIARNDALVDVLALSHLSGASTNTIKRFAQTGVIPRPVAFSDGHALFDLADPKLEKWVKALQRAGYNQRVRQSP